MSDFNNRERIRFQLVYLFSVVAIFVAIVLLSLFHEGLSSFRSLYVLLVGLCITALVIRFTKDFLAPPVLLMFVWTIGISLGQLDVYVDNADSLHLNDPWDLATWLIVLGFLSCFIAGYAIIHRFAFKSYHADQTAHFTSSMQRWGELFHTSPIKSSQSFPQWLLNRMRWCSLLFFIIAFATYAYFIKVSGGIPLLDPSPAIARQTFRLPIWGYLFQLITPAFVISAMIIGRSKSFVMVLIMLFITTLIVIVLLSTASRSDAFETVMIGWISYFLVKRKSGIRIKNSTYLIMCIIILFVFVGFMAVGGFRDAGEGGATSGFSSISNPILSVVHVYAGGKSVLNFQYALSLNLQNQHGLVLLRAPLTWLKLFDSAIVDTDIFGQINTATALFFYYLDFGIPGIFVIALFLGVLSGAVYFQMRSSKNPIWVAIYAAIAMCILWSVVTDRFFEPIMIYYVLVMITIDIFCRLRLYRRVYIKMHN